VSRFFFEVEPPSKRRNFSLSTKEVRKWTKKVLKSNINRALRNNQLIFAETTELCSYMQRITKLQLYNKTLYDGFPRKLGSFYFTGDSIFSKMKSRGKIINKKGKNSVRLSTFSFGISH